jgi:hypothetical protein
MESPYPRRAGHGLAVTVDVICDELTRRGLDAAPLLRAHDLPVGHHSPFARFPRHAILAFVDSCLALSGDPALHVVATARAELGVFHLADSIAMMAPSVGFGARSAMETFALFNSGCAWTLDERSDPVVATLRAVHERTPHHVDVECAFMAFAGRIRAASPEGHSALRLELELPDRGAGQTLARECRCEVVYGAPASRMLFARAVWEARPRFAQPLVAGLVRTGAELAAAMPSDLLADLRRAVAEALRVGRFRVVDVAQRLGVSTRSLQRRLTEGARRSPRCSTRSGASAPSICSRTATPAPPRSPTRSASRSRAPSRARSAAGRGPRRAPGAPARDPRSPPTRLDSLVI